MHGVNMNMDNYDLGDLANPHYYTEPLDISDYDPALLIRQLHLMLMIRRVEEKLGDMVAAQRIPTPCHLGIGQEAIAVGVSQHLQPTDRVFGAHRSHAHYLALGGDVVSLMAEILGRDSGCSRGMGGSMHLWGAGIGFLGSVPIVAGTVPLAVGAALAAKKDSQGAVAVVYFGDGAAEEGGIHESLNLAALWQLPVLFVCENNLFSSHMHISLRQPGSRVARYAEAHRIDAATVDGNDLVVVSRTARSMVEGMREQGGPRFMEAVTYRWRGHVGHREDNDVGVNRGTDLALWKKRDPIRRLADALMLSGVWEEDAYLAMDKDVKTEVEEAWQQADQAPFPQVSALLDRVYAGGQ